MFLYRGPPNNVLSKKGSWVKKRFRTLGAKYSVYSCGLCLHCGRSTLPLRSTLRNITHYSPPLYKCFASPDFDVRFVSALQAIVIGCGRFDHGTVYRIDLFRSSTSQGSSPSPTGSSCYSRRARRSGTDITNPAPATRLRTFLV